MNTSVAAFCEYVILYYIMSCYMMLHHIVLYYNIIYNIIYIEVGKMDGTR